MDTFYIAVARPIGEDLEPEAQVFSGYSNLDSVAEDALDFGRGILRPSGTSVRVLIYGPYEYDPENPTAETWVK
jgi:hypothetical protein